MRTASVFDLYARLATALRRLLRVQYPPAQKRETVVPYGAPPDARVVCCVEYFFGCSSDFRHKCCAGRVRNSVASFPEGFSLYSRAMSEFDTGGHTAKLSVVWPN